MIFPIRHLLVAAVAGQIATGAQAVGGHFAVDDAEILASRTCKVEGWFTDDTPKRFAAYGWNVIPDVDGHSVEAVDAAIAQAKTSDRPTLICCKTIIGKGSPNLQGGDKVHGAALGDKEVAAVREHLLWDPVPFDIPAPIYEA